MSFYGCSLLSTQKFSLEKVTQLFSLTKTIESALINNSLEFSAQWQELLQQKVAMLVFFEPSTRTSLSFQMACERIRLPYINFPAFEQSSLIKGESFEDTLFNVAAMKPDLIILRSSKGNEVTDFLEELKIPVVNAGSGVDGHPTQALLDAYTIQKRLGSVEGQKVLIVGDVTHSRVASSNLDLLRLLGAEVAICGPEEMMPKNEPKWQEIKSFNNLETALEWATVCMGLRVQLERHNNKNGITTKEYSQNYCLNPEKLKILSPNGLIMHPGPFVRDVDFSAELLHDPRCAVHAQVTHGVYIRAAILVSILVEGMAS